MTHGAGPAGHAAHAAHSDHARPETGSGGPIPPAPESPSGRVGPHQGHAIHDLRRRLVFSLALTVPILALSPFIQSLLGFRLAIPGDRLLLLALSAAVFLYGGRPFFAGLVSEMRERRPGMMTLVALAITVAFGWGVAVTFGVKGEVFFWELATLIDIMLLGHIVEMRAVAGASRALDTLARLMPSSAHRLDAAGAVADVPLADIRKGDRVLVRPGERVPADGRVVEGLSEVDQSMITGESRPVDKAPSDGVVGGSVNGTGALVVEVRGTGAESYLARVIELVRKASESKSRAQTLANRAAFGLTIVALAGGAATFAAWLVAGRGAGFAMERTVTVMVIACPHALGLAVPLVVAVITALAAGNGLLIRNRTAFEAARRLDTVVFDKTGTLTRGEFGVAEIVPLANWSQAEVLSRAASVETGSEHAIARGIIRSAGEMKLRVVPATGFAAVPGKGARALLEGEAVFVGNQRILEEAGVGAGDAEARARELAGRGLSVAFVASGGRVQGIIGLADVVRESSAEAVRRLKALGLEVVLITGDNEETAARVASELGIDAHLSGVLPDRKSERIRELQAQGKKVGMVGDGVNDAPALAQADVGIAIGAGTDVAAETADVILVESDPRAVVDIIRLSRLMRRKTAQNLAWAAGYNIVALPLAAGVLLSRGIVLAPAAGALLMALSTVLVAVNARLISYGKRAGG